MTTDFLHSTLGKTGWPVFRLGLSASYRPGTDAIRKAIDHGVNYFFAYGFDGQMLRTLRDVFRTRRDGLIIATGGYNWILWRSNLRKTLERRLKQLGTDHLDVFMFLGVMKPEQFPESVREEMMRLREEGKVRAIGCDGVRDFKLKLAQSLAAGASFGQAFGTDSAVFTDLPRPLPLDPCCEALQGCLVVLRGRLPVLGSNAIAEVVAAQLQDRHCCLVFQVDAHDPISSRDLLRQTRAHSLISHNRITKNGEESWRASRSCRDGSSATAGSRASRHSTRPGSRTGT